MFQKAWHWLVLMASLAVFGVGWILYSRVYTTTDMASIRAAPRVGFNAPSFQTSTPNGDPIALDQLRGKVVVLNFWATWCGPCRAEMPALRNVYAARQRDGLVVLAINQLEDADTIGPFTQELKLQFPIGLDQTGTINHRYQVRALPTTFFIDRRGIIRDVVIGGPMDVALLESKVASLLSEL